MSSTNIYYPKRLTEGLVSPVDSEREKLYDALQSKVGFVENSVSRSFILEYNFYRKLHSW